MTAGIKTKTARRRLRDILMAKVKITYQNGADKKIDVDVKCPAKFIKELKITANDLYKVFEVIDKITT